MFCSSSKLQNTSGESQDYDEPSNDQYSNNADNFDFTMDESSLAITPKVELNEIDQDGDPLESLHEMQQSIKEDFTPNTENTNSREQVEVREEDLFCDWIRTNLSSITDPLLRMPLYCNIVKEIQMYKQTLKDEGKL